MLSGLLGTQSQHDACDDNTDDSVVMRSKQSEADKESDVAGVGVDGDAADADDVTDTVDAVNATDAEVVADSMTVADAADVGDVADAEVVAEAEAVAEKMPAADTADVTERTAELAKVGAEVDASDSKHSEAADEAKESLEVEGDAADANEADAAIEGESELTKPGDTDIKADTDATVKLDTRVAALEEAVNAVGAMLQKLELKLQEVPSKKEVDTSKQLINEIKTDMREQVGRSIEKAVHDHIGAISEARIDDFVRRTLVQSHSFVVSTVIRIAMEKRKDLNDEKLYAMMKDLSDPLPQLLAHGVH